MTTGLVLKIAAVVALAGLAVHGLASGLLEVGLAWTVAAVLAGVHAHQHHQDSKRHRQVLLMMMPVGKAPAATGDQTDDEAAQPEANTAPKHDHDLCRTQIVGDFVKALEPLRRAAVTQVETNRAAGLSQDMAEDMGLAFYELGLRALVGGGE